LAPELNTKEIALIVVFAAIAVALTPVAIPAVYVQGFFYRLWEIPIVAAFLLFGPKIGITVALLRTLAELTFFPGPAGIIGPLFVLPVTLAMLLGIYVGSFLLKRTAQMDKMRGVKPVAYFIVFGVLFRTICAPPVSYVMFSFLLGFPAQQVIPLVPIFAVFALTLSLYTIPFGYLIARVVSRSLRVGDRL
jgi:riboflavin transporter FmnP